ncbi:MAG: hypothetical protein NVSMB32_12090 [Actinomycetota bacterium]
MESGLPALADDWIRYKRTRTRRGLSICSETAYRSDLAVVAQRVADALGRPAPEKAEPQRPGPPRPEGHQPPPGVRQLARLELEPVDGDHLQLGVIAGLRHERVD